jgi:hypothetical protein
MFQTTFTAEDALAVLAGLGQNERRVPTRLISRVDFPTAPDTSVDKPVPIPYGELRNTLSATAPPVLTGSAVYGAKNIDGVWALGFGARPSSATPPTAITLTAAASGTLSADVPDSTYGVIVTAVDANGIESDPKPYYTNQLAGSGRGTFDTGVETVTVNGSQKIQVSWSGGSGAVTYRCYLAYYYYGAQFTQVIETASTSCEFTAGPAWTEEVTPDNITPAADPSTFVQVWEYAVSAVMADGETAISSRAIGRSSPYARALKVEWLAVSGATGYRVYKRGPGQQQYILRFDVAAGATSFDDDMTNATAVQIDGTPNPAGVLPCVYVGKRADSSGFQWDAFLVAGCAIKAITTVYQGGVAVNSGNFGVSFAVPTKTGFSTYFGSNPYVDINGRRYTLLYARGPQGDWAASGEKPITVTLQGVEATGDGSGTLITSLAQQYEHWLRNFVLRNYETGNWQTTGPTWGDSPTDVDLVDGTSFDTVETVWSARHSAGCPGAWIVGLSESGDLQQETVRTWLARLNQSLDVYGGFSRKSQYVVKIINELASLTGLPQFTATLGINADTFAIEDRPDEIENDITYRYALEAPVSSWTEGRVVDVDGQTAIDGEVKPYTLSLWAVRHAGMAYEIAARRLTRRKFPYRLVRWEADMGALTVDLGDTVLVSHPDGLGSSGWTDRPVFLLRHEFDPQRFVVMLEGLDLAALRSGSDMGSEAPVVESVGTSGDGMPPWWQVPELVSADAA